MTNDVGERGAQVGTGGQVERAGGWARSTARRRPARRRSIMIAAAPGSSRFSAAQLVAVVARGLEPVMAVGEHQRRARRRCGVIAAMRIGVVDRGELVVDVVRRRCTSTAALRSARARSVSPAPSDEAPDRVDVQRGSPAATRAGPTSPSGACARAGARHRRRRSRAVASAPITPWVWRVTTVVVAVLHPVRVEAGLRVGDEHPVGAPRRERGGGALVPVALGVLVAREEEPDRVAGCSASSARELVVVDRRRRVERRGASSSAPAAAQS